MSKVSGYLNEHILGEVMVSPAVRAAYATDAGVLSITPEMVVYPRVTNDIRKVARFAWQLAEQGHSLSITARGGGTDQTSAAIGKGVVLALPVHMNKIFEIDTKQKLVRAQPGVSFAALEAALSTQALKLPAYPGPEHATLGGAIANNASGPLSGSAGPVGAWVQQLEVVLANGDVLQTERVSRRELDKRKGKQTLEGEIYRQIDGLIVDNQELIAKKIAGPIRDNTGYSGIADVKQKDGSLDLTPLFIGSQGTLGVISEAIMKVDFNHAHDRVVLGSFASYEMARDSIDELAKLKPAFLEYIDPKMLKSAASRGKKYSWYDEAESTGGVLICGFEDFSERARSKNAHRATKIFQSHQATKIAQANNLLEAQSLLAVRDIALFLRSPEVVDTSLPGILDGMSVPLNRFDDFMNALELLSKKYRMDLPVYGRMLDGVLYTQPSLQFKKVGDKQKIFKLLGEYSNMVAAHDGQLVADSGEGRIKTPFAYKQLDDDVTALYEQIKSIFDPYNILNPGVKQNIDLKTLVSQLRSDTL